MDVQIMKRAGFYCCVDYLRLFPSSSLVNFPRKPTTTSPTKLWTDMWNLAEIFWTLLMPMGMVDQRR